MGKGGGGVGILEAWSCADTGIQGKLRYKDTVGGEVENKIWVKNKKGVENWREITRVGGDGEPRWLGAVSLASFLSTPGVDRVHSACELIKKHPLSRHLHASHAKLIYL